MPEAPFYVRVFSPDRSYAGSYKISFHQHRGESAEDAIGLTPGKPYDYAWPANQPLNSEDQAWFFFHTNTGDRGDYPTLRFFLNRYEANTSYKMSPRDDVPSSYPLRRFDKTKQIEGGRTYVGDIRGLDGKSGGDQKIYYLTVQRDAPSTVQEKTTLRFVTDLTYFYPKKLWCVVENDGPGIDEIYYYVDTDGSGSGSYSLNSDFKFFSDMEEGSVFSAAPMGVRRYVKSLVPNLIEEDSGFNGDNDYLLPIKNNPNRNPDAPWQLAPLSPDRHIAEATYTWGDAGNVDDADYWYHLIYELRHEAK